MQPRCPCKKVVGLRAVVKNFQLKTNGHLICFLQSRNSGFYAGGWHTFAMSCSHRSGCSLGHARRLPWVGNCQNDMFTRNPISCAWRWWSTGHFLGYWGWQVEELVWLVVWAWQKSFGPATKKNMQLRSILLLHVKCMVTLNVLTRSWIETSKKGTSHPKGCMLIYFLWYMFERLATAFLDGQPAG